MMAERNGAICAGSPSCCSSKCRIPQRNRRYKTVENFLRRMAFNLGNTVSQTDVKILSCIPIDVTDLQQRIQQLEKELSEKKEAGAEKNKESEESDGNEATVMAIHTDNRHRTNNAPIKNADEPNKNLKEHTNDDKPNKNLRDYANYTKTDIPRDYFNEDPGRKDVQSLYKAEDDKKNSKKYMESSSFHTDASAHRSIHKSKRPKSNNYTVIMGNTKKRRQTRSKHREKTNKIMHEETETVSSFSITLPVSKRSHRERSPYRYAETKVDRSNLKLKKRINKSKDRIQSPIPQHQYVYYAQTDCRFNPDLGKDKCDLSYIANLIEKQYAPTGLYPKQGMDLSRQYSMPECHDKSELVDKYPINTIGGCSCFDDGILNNDDPIYGANTYNFNLSPYQHNTNSQHNNNKRFYDCTQYDIVPVKQKANKKCNRTSVEIIPPLNLHPSQNYENPQDCKDACQEMYHQYDAKSVSQKHQYRNHTGKKKSAHPRNSSPSKATNKNKVTLGPEDIYMTKQINADETTDNVNAAQNKEKNKNTQLMDVKAILQDLIKEIKHDIPKLHESNQCKLEIPNNTTACAIHTPNTLVNSCLVSSFSPVLPTTQCCPILCPINFVPEGYANQLNQRPMSESRTIDNDAPSKGQANTTNTCNNDGLSETKKLIEEIYKSVSLQSEDKILKVNTEVIKEKLEGDIDRDERKQDLTQGYATRRNRSDNTTETENVCPNLSNRSPPSFFANSSFANSNEYGDKASNVKIKSSKKSPFSTFVSAIKKFAFKKKKESESRSEMEVNNVSYEERPPFRQNILQYSVTCQHGRSASPTTRANKTANTENRPGDVYNCCHLEAERSRNRERCCQQEGRDISTRHNCCHQSSHRWPVDEGSPHRHSECDNKNCYFMSDPHHIPFCLKEIEVKNAGTQSDKKRKLFAIFKKIKMGEEREYTSECIMPSSTIMTKDAGPTRAMRGKKNKPGLLQLLKGDISFNNAHIDKYSMWDPNGDNIGMRYTTNTQPPKPKKKSKWGQYARAIEKKKKQKDLTQRFLSRNPFSLKNMFMKNVMGNRPEPDMRQAKLFY